MSSSVGSSYPLTQIIQGKLVKILYLDLNSQYTEDGQQLVLENIAAVNGEILNLIMTPIGSRHFEPEVGSAIPDLLFDQPSTVTIWVMKNKLFEAITRWMPYVQFDYKNSIIVPLQDSSGYYFRLIYSIFGLDGNNVKADFRFTT
jgi:phage baseplate assembly protein W